MASDQTEFGDMAVFGVEPEQNLIGNIFFISTSNL